MKNNICRFVPYHKDYHSVHTINFVYEQKKQKFEEISEQSVYTMHYVCKGKGFLHKSNQTLELTKGDIFFRFPGEKSAIESGEDFEYMYISFLGSRGNMIMDKLNITCLNCIFHAYDEVEEFWKNSIGIDSELSELIIESVLLYTFSVMGTKILKSEKNDSNKSATPELIKKYIDDNFSEPDLSLDKISTALSYNKKYISTVFKKKMNISIVEYINTIRIQYACSLPEQGITSVKDISTMCGYSDSLYFSKVFKRKMGLSPKEYIEAKRK